MKLFEDDWGVDQSPIEEIEITTTLLYYNKDELLLFKKLCKKAMQIEYPENFREDGNISDLLLKILKKYYANR